MKNIVFVVTSMGRGGAERVISILSDDYARRGWKVHIVMLWHHILEYDLHPDVEVIDLSNDKKNPFVRIPQLIKAFRKIVKKLCPEAVVSFIAQNNIISWLACRGLKVRFIPSERIDPSAMNRNFLLTKAIDVVYGHSTTTVLQTERARRYFPQKVQNKSVIIPNPVSVKEYASEIKSKRIVTAGRLTDQKNHKMLIDAFAILHDKYPEYQLVIYGEGVLRETLEQQIEDKGLTGAVLLPGNVSNVHEQMTDAAMFVLSSNFEGVSNALLEAMMMGLPCISTDCAGSDEAIEDGRNGLLVPVGNTKKLTEAMLKLAEDHDLRTKLGAAAKESAELYKVENIIKQWIAVIEEGID